MTLPHLRPEFQPSDEEKEKDTFVTTDQEIAKHFRFVHADYGDDEETSQEQSDAQ